MLSNISIENFIIIDKLTINFQEKFTAITGETGTGKSIIIDAIDFCFGNFSSKNVKKYQDKQCLVTLNFKLDTAAEIEHITKLTLSKEIVIKKTIDCNNKANYYINEYSIASKLLKDLKGYFVDITAQSDSILATKSQRQILDMFMLSTNSNCADGLLKISELCDEIHDINRKIEKLDSDSRIIKRDKEYYLQIVTDLEKIDIIPNKETELLSKRAEISKLCASCNLIKSAIEVLKSAGFEAKLSSVIKNLDKIDSDTVDKLKSRTESILIEILDISSELELLNENIHENESQILKIDDRISIIRSIARKSNIASSILFELLIESKSKLEASNNIDSQIGELTERRDQIFKKYKDISSLISKNRKDSAIELSKLVCDKLDNLLMPNATFKIDVFKNDSLVSQYGQDEIEFLANFNEKSYLMPISQIASGGETARLNFALKTILGIYGSSDCIIFDEVDIGIGGAAAYSMGNAMKKLGKDNGLQIISITHSPQVAARSDSHIVIKKHVTKNNIDVFATNLNTEERTNEIARMISGETINHDAILAAKQLIGI